jgi:exosortase
MEPGWTGGLIRPLLPLPDTTILDNLLARLQRSLGGSGALLCANGRTQLIVDHLQKRATGLAAPRVLEDKVPLGTAGCVKLCEPEIRSSTFFVAGAAVWLDDDPRWMLEQHRGTGNVMTVFCTKEGHMPGLGGSSRMRPAGIYCCEAEVLRHISPGRFQDIKEQLVPALQRAGLRVGAVCLRGRTTEVCDWPAYLRLMSASIQKLERARCAPRRIGESVWCGQGADVAPTAKIVGPVFIGEAARIGGRACVIGPAFIGASCDIQAAARVIRSVVCEKARLRAGIYADRVVPAQSPVSHNGTSAHSKDAKSLAWSGRRLLRPVPMMRLAIAAVFAWAFSPTLGPLLDVLRTSPDYSAGLLAPLAAGYMLSASKDTFRGLPSNFWLGGVLMFLAGTALNLFGGLLSYSFFENVGLMVAVNGVLASILGKELYRRLLVPLLFLFVMVPLPHRVHDAVMQPLQGLVARASTWLLEAGGIPTERYGNVLEIAGARIAVAEACSGLRLALAFFIVTAVVAYTVRKPAWQKAAVLLSCVPIALGCNVLRVCSSAYLHYIGLDGVAQGAFHDGAGLVMMPVALLLVYAEFWVLSRMVEVSTEDRPLKGNLGSPVLAGATA